MQYGTRVKSNSVVEKQIAIVHRGNPVQAKVETSWTSKFQKISGGIFLGKRALPYGETAIHTGQFVAKGYKTVALVSPDGKRNPVYVDLKEISEDLDNEL